jgi:hypothetical protein
MHPHVVHLDPPPDHHVDPPGDHHTDAAAGHDAQSPPGDHAAAGHDAQSPPGDHAAAGHDAQSPPGDHAAAGHDAQSPPGDHAAAGHDAQSPPGDHAAAGHDAQSPPGDHAAAGHDAQSPPGDHVAAGHDAQLLSGDSGATTIHDGELLPGGSVLPDAYIAGSWHVLIPNYSSAPASIIVDSATPPMLQYQLADGKLSAVVHVGADAKWTLIGAVHDFDRVVVQPDLNTEIRMPDLNVEGQTHKAAPPSQSDNNAPPPETASTPPSQSDNNAPPPEAASTPPSQSDNNAPPPETASTPPSQSDNNAPPPETASAPPSQSDNNAPPPETASAPSNQSDVQPPGDAGYQLPPPSSLPNPSSENTDNHGSGNESQTQTFTNHQLPPGSQNGSNASMLDDAVRLAGLFNFEKASGEGVSGGIPGGMGPKENAGPNGQFLYAALSVYNLINMIKSIWLGAKAFASIFKREVLDTIGARIAGDRALREGLKELTKGTANQSGGAVALVVKKTTSAYLFEARDEAVKRALTMLQTEFQAELQAASATNQFSFGLKQKMERRLGSLADQEFKNIVEQGISKGELPSTLKTSPTVGIKGAFGTSGSKANVSQTDVWDTATGEAWDLMTASEKYIYKHDNLYVGKMMPDGTVISKLNPLVYEKLFGK